MKTIEQIARKHGEYLNDLFHDELMEARGVNYWFGAGPLSSHITAAIHEAAAPQVDWENAVDWPDEPGLWWALEGSHVSLVDTFTDSSGEFTAIPIGKSGAYAIRNRSGMKFFGPMTPPLPAPPKPPSPWDYEPKDGDYVWVKHPSDSLFVSRVYAERDDVFITDPHKEISVLRKSGYRFALAQVSPAPPEE